MQTSAKSWYIADPVHQFVEFGRHQDTIKALTRTRVFQRLRRISQLGLASFVFPGAVHSRFSHSLGAAHLAALLVEQLHVEEAKGKAVVCAALLHDVGHGPFSHSFEHALRQVLPNRPTHEDWTKAIILRSLNEPLRAHGVDPALVCALVSSQNDAPSVPTFLRQVISSQLDVDRLDYLSRDAHFSGVPIGRIDLQYLVRNIRVVEHGNEKTLGLTAKGVASYEAFAFARHVMTKTVYYHKQVATFESMMEECIRLLVEGEAQGQEPALLHAIRLADREKSPTELTGVLLESYLKITEDQLWTLLDTLTRRDDRLGHLSNLLLERKPVPSFLVAKHKHEVLERELSAAGFKPHQFRVRQLKRNLYKESTGEQIFVLGRHGEPPAHITSKSSLVAAFGDHTDTDAVLVIFDEDAKPGIVSAAKRAHCLDRADSIPPSRPLTKTRGDEAALPGADSEDSTSRSAV